MRHRGLLPAPFESHAIGRVAERKHLFKRLDIEGLRGLEAGLRQNGKMIITRGDNLVAKVQIVKVESRSSVANLLPDWTKGSVQSGDVVMTSYEARAK